jgi:hypothetical protein
MAVNRERGLFMAEQSRDKSSSFAGKSGKLQDKLEPCFANFHGYLTDMPGRRMVDCALKNLRIVFEPLAFMRGKTYDDTLCPQGRGAELHPAPAEDVPDPHWRKFPRGDQW